jgi:DNA (cytosine-5)-methyltransferase 1
MRNGAPHSFYEFFAGGGMARAGLGPEWECLFANDFDFKKSAVYNDNWGAHSILTKSVDKITTDELPASASLAWASFPCQDLSLAGMGAGLRGDRSGTFWPFWNLIIQLQKENRAPSLVVLENVLGALTSHDGKDFVAIADAFSSAEYQFGAFIIDAAEFLPHSRPRLFIVGAAKSTFIPKSIVKDDPCPSRHTKGICAAYARLSEETRKHWVWWNIPKPPKRALRFADLVEENPIGVQWHTKEETEKLLAMMSPLNRKKVEVAKRTGMLHVGTIYKRTRLNENGIKVQRAEIRFDEIAGCLRTARGGSSRQFILVVKGEGVRSRLISIRETARLMGLEEDYKLPAKYNEAYHLTGDGVAVPVVRHIAKNVLEPILTASLQ